MSNKYDWSLVGLEGRVLFMSEVSDDVDKGLRLSTQAEWQLMQCRKQALVPPLRTRAEVDAEISEIVREYTRDVGALSAFGSMGRDRQKLLSLVAEPLAPDPNHTDVISHPDDHEPCSCEESERLKLQVAELSSRLEKR
jgi:hypothetical protein